MVVDRSYICEETRKTDCCMIFRLYCPRQNFELENAANVLTPKLYWPSLLLLSKETCVSATCLWFGFYPVPDYFLVLQNLPCEFIRECFPRANRKLKLWDPQGKSWDVNYVYYSERSVGALSGGWGKFAVGNNLETFDVCVFELISKDNVKVHIYRVVPEITPFLPGPGRK